MCAAFLYDDGCMEHEQICPNFLFAGLQDRQEFSDSKLGEHKFSQCSGARIRFIEYF